MTTLVLCIDGGELASDGPIVGEAALGSLVTEAGVEDPEDSRVNCLLETLRVAQDLRGEGDEPVVSLVSGAGGTVGADRTVARHTDTLVAEHEPESAIVIVDSAKEERLVPIVESRVRVDAVDRVVVRQAHDIESSYYLLKQFLADEELRATVLIPLGAALLAFPLLLFLAESLTVAVSAIAAVIGSFLLYKGLGVDDYVAMVPAWTQDALYSGQVSLVTYVVGGGLALVGLFAGAIGVSATPSSTAELIVGMRFLYDAVPWFALAALTGSTGRLIDELLSEEGVRTSLLNLPFGVLAVGLVVRGFAGYFLERAAIIPPMSIPAGALGPISVSGVSLSIWTRLALFVVAGIAVSLVGVQFASYVTSSTSDIDLTKP